MEIIVIGHLNPDTDSIVSALGVAKFLEEEGKKALACRAGNLNNESLFVLDYCGLNTEIEDIKKVGLEEKEIIFVDFNEEGQSPIDSKEVKLRGILDHHKLSCSFKTEEPIFFRMEPVGSTSTLVLKLSREKNIDLGEPIEKALLCGIISDTLDLSSPTTTNEERFWVDYLTKKLHINQTELAERLFEAKSDLSAFTSEQIVKLDWKNFEFEGNKIGIGVIETVKPGQVKKIEQSLREALAKVKEEEKLDFAYLGIVDIIKNETEMLIISEKEKEIIMKSFSDIRIDEDSLILRGIVSRKKQIAPAIERAMENN